jgi:hypothetical protein
MHIVVMLVCVPTLALLFLVFAVWLPVQLMAEGAASGTPGAVVAGILLFVLIWGGIFAAFSH